MSHAVVAVPPYLLTCRVTIAILNLVGYAVVFILRFNLSVAIVCMVKEEQDASNSSAFPLYNSSSGDSNQTVATHCAGADNGGSNNKLYNVGV